MICASFLLVAMVLDEVMQCFLSRWVQAFDAPVFVHLMTTGFLTLKHGSVNQAHAALIKERRRLFEILNRSALDDSWENASVDEVFDPNCHDVSTLSIVNL